MSSFRNLLLCLVVLNICSTFAHINSRPGPRGPFSRTLRELEKHHERIHDDLQGFAEDMDLDHDEDPEHVNELHHKHKIVRSVRNINHIETSNDEEDEMGHQDNQNDGSFISDMDSTAHENVNDEGDVSGTVLDRREKKNKKHDKGDKKHKGHKKAKRHVDNQPNVIIILADDLGYNDVGYHNENVVTPTIDSLMENGIKLDQHYALPLCTPSRYAIMSGVYPFKAGMSHGVESAFKAHCAPTFNPFLPEFLSEVGYTSIMVGKWHLGFCDEKCTPNGRGFDKSFGYYNGYTTYFDHMSSGGFDLHRDNIIDRSQGGVHTMTLFSDYITEQLSEHNPEDPLFMYLSFPTPHSPYAAEKKYLDLYADLDVSQKRKTFLALVSMLDHSIDRLVNDLKDNDMYDNTIIIFQSDNGGATFGPASNVPLRGTKLSLFEGGVKVPAFISSPLIPDEDKGSVITGITHTLDVPATIMDLAGVSEDKIDNIDGISFADIITEGGESEREEFVLNMDLEEPKLAGQEALRSGKWKIIRGLAGLFTGYGNDIVLIQPVLPEHMVGYFKSTGVDTSTLDENKILLDDVLLFNVEDDPTELNNVAVENPDVVDELLQKLDAYAEEYQDSFKGASKEEGLPSNNEGAWRMGWCSINENGIEN